MNKDKDIFLVFCKAMFLFILIVTSLFSFVIAGEDKVSAIVIEKDSFEKVGGLKTFSEARSKDLVKDSITHTYSSFDGYAGNFTSEELEILREDPSVEVYLEKTFYALLDGTVNQIRGNDTWNLELEGENLTGTGQTVCILDTGVNYTHTAFGGCYGDNNASSNCTVIGGWDYVNNDNDPIDDNGHGTHVSGIVASGDSTYRGVSYGSKIVHVKVLNSVGVGGTANVVKGIDWCVSNASAFNISVITMSLGDNETYNNYCSGGSIETAINAAVAAGIPVVVAAGNCVGPDQPSCTVGVSYPACLTNATAAGAVNNNDAITYMRSPNIFELLAPGVLVRSTIIGGGFDDKSGTSMAAPHIAGAIAILQQFSNLQDGIDLAHDILRNSLNNTGVRIDDSLGSGANFTRINIYDALLSLDARGPVVSQVSPLDSAINITVNQTFTCNATDWQLSNMSLHLWNATGLYNTSTNSFSGKTNESSFAVNEIPEGAYTWNCFSYDLIGNGNFSALNNTLTIGGVFVVLDSPIDSNYTNVNETNYTCTVTSEATYELSNVTFSLWNLSSDEIIYDESEDISGLTNTSNFNYTFSTGGNYSWNCLGVNNVSNSTSATANYTVNFDSMDPIISSLSSSVTTSTSRVTWTTDESSNSSVGGDVSGNDSSFVTSHSIAITGLSASTSYSFVATSCDRASNCVNFSSSFTTSAAAASSGGGGSSGGGSSGGGGSSSRPSLVNFILTEQDLEEKAVSLEIGSGEKVSLEIGSLNHTLTMNSVGVNSVSLTIESDPVYLTLFVGESAKLNLSSSKYYDTLVSLNGINSEVANISIEKINLSMFENVDLDADKTFYALENDPLFTQDYLIFIIIVLGVLFFYYMNRKKLKGQKSYDKHGKSKKAKAKTLSP